MTNKLKTYNFSYGIINVFFFIKIKWKNAFKSQSIPVCRTNRANILIVWYSLGVNKTDPMLARLIHYYLRPQGIHHRMTCEHIAIPKWIKLSRRYTHQYGIPPIEYRIIWAAFQGNLEVSNILWAQNDNIWWDAQDLVVWLMRSQTRTEDRPNQLRDSDVFQLENQPEIWIDWLWCEYFLLCDDHLPHTYKSNINWISILIISEQNIIHEHITVSYNIETISLRLI